MKDKWQIILSGVGGQGLIASGSILGEAATVHQGLYATLTSSYGIETRGTFSKSDVIISRSPIRYPEVITADIVMALAPVAYYKYVGSLMENAVLLYDESTIANPKASKASQCGYPFTHLSKEMGNVSVANMIGLGVIVSKTGLIEREAVIKSIREKYGERESVAELNVAAFEKGLELA